MKLLIEIPEELKRALDNNEEYRLYTESVGHVTLMAIKYGKPLDSVLDEIRAEIENIGYLNIEDGSGGYDNYVNRYDVLQIIDKYKEGSDKDADSD